MTSQITKKLTAFDSPCRQCKQDHSKEWLDKNCPEGGCACYRFFITLRMREK